MIKKKEAKRLTSAKDLLVSHDWLVAREQSAKYINTEHQDFGMRIASKLNDMKHKALYMRLAKEEYRPIVEKALSFALDYPKATSRGRIFMWKLKELRKDFEAKE